MSATVSVDMRQTSWECAQVWLQFCILVHVHVIWFVKYQEYEFKWLRRLKNCSNYCHYVDINECASSDTHSCSQSCINTNGSYDCFCSNGYIKRFKYFCFGITVDTLIAMLAVFLIDINECSNSSLHNCTSNEVCQNTVGGFACQCKEGFTRGNDDTTCERMLTLMYEKH